MLSVLILVVAGACPSGVFCNTSGAPTTATLHGGAVISATDAWVVGEWGTALHWDGTNWQLTPTGSSETLSNVVALGPKDVWAVGSSSVLHFDGAWHEVVPHSPSIFAVRVTVQPRPGVIWVLGHDPMVIEGGQVKPLEGAATGLSVDGSIISAAACAPDQLWSIARSRSSGLSVQFWNGAVLRTQRQPFRMNVGKVVCVEGVAWISTDDTLFACTPSSGCEPMASPPSPRLVDAPFGPLLISKDRLLIRRKGEFRELGTVPSGTLGAVATSVDQVLLSGASGAVSWFLGAAAPQPRTLKMGNLTSVVATLDGRAWAGSTEGLFFWNGSRWERDPSFPVVKERDIELASAGAEVWAATDGHAHRFEKTWKAMTDSSVAIRGLFVRGKDDVFGFGRETLRHWNGRQWTEVTKAKPGFSWTALTGTATTLYGLARGPRPEAADGPSTGLPDEIMVLELNGTPRWIKASYRPEALAVVTGELWSFEHGGVNRLIDGKWVPLEGSVASAIIPTERGALLLSGGNKAMEWDGKSLTTFQLPGAPWTGTSAGSTVWLVGFETALRRAP